MRRELLLRVQMSVFIIPSLKNLGPYLALVLRRSGVITPEGMANNLRVFSHNLMSGKVDTVSEQYTGYRLVQDGRIHGPQGYTGWRIEAPEFTDPKTSANTA